MMRLIYSIYKITKNKEEKSLSGKVEVDENKRFSLSVLPSEKMGRYVIIQAGKNGLRSCY